MVRMWKDAVAAYSTVLLHMPGAEENHEELSRGKTVSGKSFEPGAFQIRSRTPMFRGLVILALLSYMTSER